MSRAGARFAQIGAAAVTLFAAGSAALVTIGKTAVETGMVFDSAMSQVAATMGLTQDEIDATGGSFEKLRNAATKYGSETAFTATQCAEALNYMALAGYDADTSISMLPNVLSLAAAGSIDLAYASDMITDSQTALGLTLEDTNTLVDQMAKTSSKSNTNVQQLGEAILTVGGTAKYMKGGTEELNMVLGVLADNGIKGSEAGTHLRNMLLSLSSPTKEAQNELKKLGVNIFDASGNMRSFSSIFPELNRAMAGMTDQQKLDAFSTLFNTRDIAAATALLGTTTERWTELGDAIIDSQGAAELMAATQLDNLKGDITILTSALEGLEIQISDALSPALREFVQLGTDGLSQLTEAFNEGGIKKAFGAFGTVLSGLVQKLVKYAPDFSRAATELILAFTSGLIDSLPDLISAVVVMTGDVLTSVGEALPELIPMVITAFTTLVENLVTTGLPMLLDAVFSLISGAAQGILDALPILIEALPKIVIGIVDFLLKTALPKIVETIPQIIKAIVDALTGDALDELIDAGFLLLTSLIGALPDIITTIIGKIPEIINSIFAALTSGESLEKIIMAGVKLLVALVENLPLIIKEIIKAAPQIVTALVNAFKALGYQFLDIGHDMVMGIFNGISNATTWLYNKLSGWVKSVLNYVKKKFGIASPSKEMAIIGRYDVQGFAKGIDDETPEVENSVDAMVDTVFTRTRRIKPILEPFDLSGVMDSVSGTLGLAASASVNSAPIIVYSYLTGSVDVDGTQLATIMLQNIDDAASFTF